jgi:hypothetical protein
LRFICPASANQRTEPPIKEDQLDPVPFVSDAKAFLPGYKGEIAAEFQQEVLQVNNQRLVEITLRILVSTTQELKDE